MKLLKIVSCIVLTGALSSLALADGQSAKLEKLYVDSGLELMINYMPSNIRQSIESEKSTIAPGENVPDEFWDLLLERVEDDFSPRDMKRVLMEDLAEGMTDQEIDKNLEWSNTSIGIKAKGLIEAVYSDEGTIALEQCMAGLAATPPAQDRMQQVRTLDELAQGTEFNLEIIKIMQSAIMTAANLSLPSQQQIPAEQINQQIDRLIDPIQGQLATYTQSSYICIFKPLSNDEMDLYLAELKEPHADRFYKAMVKGLKQAFFNGSFAFGKSVAQISRQLQDHQEI